MTKELELFKKWFGWDLDVIFASGQRDIKYDICINACHIPYYVRFSTNSTSFNMIDIDFKHVKRFFRPQVAEKYIAYLEVPPQHHPEWEEYVKEKKDD